MPQKRWAIAIVGLANIVLFATRVYAQTITPDGTATTTVNTTGLDATITNGTAAGTNLFHSFQRFDIPTGGSATFNLVNTPNLTTIFSRVTGGIPSNIDGAIRTTNSLNPVSLFLMNPSGIIFGPNASLNIGGSFVGTTASSIKFADGSDFASTATPLPASLLTINVPIGLQMGQNPGNISSQARVLNHAGVVTGGLQVKTGQSLVLVGGEIKIDQGGLYAPGGRVELAAIAGIGTVGLSMGANQMRVQVPAELARADVALLNGGTIDVTSANGGSIAISAQNLRMIGNSPRIRIWVEQSTGNQPPGDIDVDIVDRISIDTGGFVNRVNSTTGQASGMSGNINIKTGSLFLTNGAQIVTSTTGVGKSGDINLVARDTIFLDGIRNDGISSGLFSSVRPGANGNGGKLNLNARSVVVKNSAVIGTAALGQGNGGNIYLNTQSLDVLNGGQVSSTSFSNGNAGTIVINASDRITLRGSDPLYYQRLATQGRSRITTVDPASGLFANADSNATGNGGSLKVITGRLTIQDQAQVNVSSQGTKNAGDLTIQADSINLDRNGLIRAEVTSGNQGNVTVNANSLILRHNSNITTNATGSANGGNIFINSPVIVGLENSDIIANAIKGKGGNINITTQGILGLKFRPQRTPNNDITASSEFGVNGTVQISTPGIDPDSGLVALAADFADPTQQIAAGCAGDDGSSFIATGRGGIPVNPTQELRSDRTWHDTRDFSTFRSPAAIASTPPPLHSSTPIIEANAIRRNADGTVALVATQTAQPPLWQTCASRLK